MDNTITIEMSDDSVGRWFGNDVEAMQYAVTVCEAHGCNPSGIISAICKYTAALEHCSEAIEGEELAVEMVRESLAIFGWEMVDEHNLSGHTTSRWGIFPQISFEVGLVTSDDGADQEVA